MNHGRKAARLLGCAAVLSALLPAHAEAVSLDKDGDIKLGVRAYVNARIGTEHTDGFVRRIPDLYFPGHEATDPVPVQIIEERSFTFPRSAPGHLRQNRLFIEAELKHDLDRLVERDVGPLGLLNLLPFKVKRLRYGLTYRGEGDGLYDWGPSEYSQAWGPEDFQISLGDVLPVNPVGFRLVDDPACNQIPSYVPPGGIQCQRQVDVGAARRKLRKQATHRSRLFQAYVEGSVKRLWFRFGRQIISWGETDSFRLLDNINPVDSSFGGFLVPLDERRVPLDMLRLQYGLGSFGPFGDPFVELYGAVDNKVAFNPGTPKGSPWTLPNVGDPSPISDVKVIAPRRNFTDMRGGGRFVWNMFDGTFSVAHYYTYLDTPAVQIFVDPNGGFPTNTRGDGFSSLAVQSAPRVRVSGGSTTFAVPSLYSVVRSEIAFLENEPRARQSGLDPYVFTNLAYARETDELGRPIRRTFGERRTGESINFVLGLDVNQYVRFLNPQQTFFFTTQFFYKHLRHATETGPIVLRGVQPGRRVDVMEGEVLPVPASYIRSPTVSPTTLATQPVFVRQPTDQFLQTLLITTSYRSGTVIPSLLFFYDWGGAFVCQPSILLSRDPFRFAVDYSFLEAGRLKGGSGVSLLRDRDNIQFRFEYVI